MREIKLRAWDKKTKTMRPINTIAFHYEKESFDYDSSRLPKVVNIWGNDIIEDKSIILHREITDVELMQSIGLQDKNGKEIYANSDIFKFKYLKELHNPIDLTGIFTFNHDDLRYEIDIIGNKEYTCLCYVGNGIFYDFEIIGTKQENPELLGE